MLQPPAAPPQAQDDGALRLQPLDRFAGSLGQKVYQTLRAAILSLAYRPGEILRKPEICHGLGVSRSPVSDAVARLAAEGLVDVVPQAGTFVARFSMDEIREGAFLREAIEVAAAERVARTITEDQLTLLHRNLTVQAALVLAGDFPGFYQQDAAMHEAILSFTGFRRPAQVADTAWLHVNRARQLILPMPGRVADTLQEHRAIVAALAAHDPMAARLAVQRHLGQLLRFLEPLERDRPDLFTEHP
jgi:GntR family transcriptional regulator, rspAB operon transcriptional repressor